MTPHRVRPLDAPDAPGLLVFSLGLAVLLAQSLALESGRPHAVTSDGGLVYDTDRYFRVPITPPGVRP